MKKTLAEMNPITRLYEDIVRILDSITIKYKYRADQEETLSSKSRADRYINALSGLDIFTQYDDYSIEEFQAAGITDLDVIAEYQQNRFAVPVEYRSKLLALRRAREIENYVEVNNYYRMLTGLPDLDDTDFIYLPEELCERYSIPADMPVHEIAEKKGVYYVTLLNSIGYFDELIEKYPEKEYLRHIGSHRVTLSYARRASNFAILTIAQETIMESTYREFVRSYEKARTYFMSTIYVYELRNVIPYYENFIALCIFVMAIQQVSMRSIKNAVEREFYDEYMVRLLYETYGVPYFAKADHEVQKQICQNINLLIQNKATNKVLLDVASILGFQDFKIYQYFLVKQHNFDEKGRPIIIKKKRINPSTGEEEEVYDWEKMQSIYFQKVPIDEIQIKQSLTNPINRVEYGDVTYYDPFWWEDDDLHTEIWDKAYNYIETKYLGATIPYRMTELLFKSVVLLRMIMEKKDDFSNLTINLPKITDKKVKLSDAVILFFALMAKKLKVSGQILTTPSKIAHVLEITDQVINKEEEHIEILSFNFDAFSPEKIEETRAIIEPYLVKRKYRVVNGHDVDLMADGTQDPSAPTHKVSYTEDTTDLDRFFSYITQLSIPEGTAREKREALNAVYDNIEALYDFLSYRLTETDNLDEYYALKKFYETAFYSRETAKMFTVETDTGTRPAETFEEYFMYTDREIYQFLQEAEVDKEYIYIDHIIYKMEEVINDIGYLYILNDGYSPLVELLQILIKFFKSYRLDFIDMASLMILDWDMEQTLRFFSRVEHIRKVNQIDEIYGTEFMDLVSKMVATYRIEDIIKVQEYIKAYGHIKVSDKMNPLQDALRMVKVDAVNEAFALYEVIDGVTGRIKVNEGLHFEDFCIKKIKEDVEDV